MANQDEQLLRALSRRNWIILAVFLLVSLWWRSPAVTLGVLSGGLVVILGYYWRYNALCKLLGAPSQFAAKRFQLGYYIRLVALGSALFLLITQAQIDLIALAVGLSVVLVNVLGTTLKRLFE
ncbi:MAG: ATP synthase subunit I [Desulfuromonadaceae bacterium]